MFQLDEKKVKGTLSIRSHEKSKKIERKLIRKILAEEMGNEKDLIRRYDYKLLMDSIMGIEAIIINQKELKIVYNPETGWRREGDGIITENAKLCKVIRNVLNDETPKRKGAL